MNLIPQERDGRKVLFGIRPEHLEPCAESEAKLSAEIDLIEPLGADTLVYGHLGNGTELQRAFTRPWKRAPASLPCAIVRSTRTISTQQTGARI